MIRVIVKTDPFDSDTRQIFEVPYQNQTLALLHENYLPDTPKVRVRVNGVLVCPAKASLIKDSYFSRLKSWFGKVYGKCLPKKSKAKRDEKQLKKSIAKQDAILRNFVVKDHDEIIIVPDIDADVIAGIASIISAAIWGGATTGLGYAITYALVYVALLVGMAYLIQSLNPPPDPADEARGSPSFTFNQVTTQVEGIPIQRAYGRNKHMMNIIAGWSTPAGFFEEMDLTLCLGRGPCEGIVADSIRINDQPFSNFTGLSAAYERRGLIDQTTLSSLIKTNYRLKQRIKNADGWFYWTTPNDDFDYLEIGISFAGFSKGKNGKDRKQWVNAYIQIREVGEEGEESWHTLTYGAILVAKDLTTYNFLSNTIYQGGSPVTITRGKRYQVRVSNSYPDWNEDRKVNVMFLDSIREVSNVGYTYPELALLRVYAIASKFLHGPCNVSCIQEGRIVQVYDGENWSLEYSNNPAWILIDLLTLPVISGDGDGTPYAVEYYEANDISKIIPNLANFYAFAQYCDALVDNGNDGTEPRFTFNGIFDQGTSLHDAIKQVCTVSRCKVLPVGTNFDIVWDEKWSEAPVQLFSAANMIHNTYKRNFLSTTDRVAELEIRYLDALQNYKLIPYTLVNNNISNVFKKTVINGMGITSEGQAYRRAFFELAKSQYIGSACTFDTDWDAIACQIGDVVSIVPPYHNSGRVVVASAPTKITLDRVPEDLSGSDTISIRMHSLEDEEDVVESHAILSVSGTEVTIDGTWSDRPSEDDVYAITPTADAADKWRILGITHKANGRFSIIAMEYHDECYAGDEGTPVIGMKSYITPSTFPSPDYMIPFSKNEQLTANAPDWIKEFNIDVVASTNLEFESNQPSAGYVRWSGADDETAILITFGEDTYEIANNNTNKEFIYWDPDGDPEVFVGTDDLSDIKNYPNRKIVCTNTDGTKHPTQLGQQIIHGGLIQASTITAAYGQIANATIGTLEVIDHAIIDGGDYWVGAELGITYQVETDIAEVTYESFGAKMFLQISFSPRGTAAGGFDWSKWTFRVYRDAIKIYESAELITYANHYSLFAFNISDAPGAGEYTYKVTAQLTSSSPGGQSGKVSNRSLHVHEFKR